MYPRVSTVYEVCYRLLGFWISYFRQLDYRRIRVGYLYGEFKSNDTVKVEFLYEPPQETTDMHFKLLENEKEVCVC